MKIQAELTEQDLKRLVLFHFQRELGMSLELTHRDIQIEVKSKQNYKSEWESASFRARIDKSI